LSIISNIVPMTWLNPFFNHIYDRIPVFIIYVFKHFLMNKSKYYSRQLFWVPEFQIKQRNMRIWLKLHFLSAFFKPVIWISHGLIVRILINV
jgi:hypothetical protein